MLRCFLQLGLLGFFSGLICLSGCLVSNHRHSVSIGFAGEDTILVRVEQRFELVLPSLVGAGYVWQPKEISSALIRLDSSYQQSDAPTPFAPASAPKEVLAFTARQTGTEHLKLYLVRPWEMVPTDSTHRTVIITEN